MQTYEIHEPDRDALINFIGNSNAFTPLQAEPAIGMLRMLKPIAKSATTEPEIVTDDNHTA